MAGAVPLCCPLAVLVEVHAAVQQQLANLYRIVSDTGVERVVVIQSHPHPLFQKLLCDPAVLFLTGQHVQGPPVIGASGDPFLHQC